MTLPKRILLDGPIGCGKSSLIRGALGDRLRLAGGFLTLRETAEDRLLGFSLNPADGSAPGRWFLDFSSRPPQNDRVFADLGVRLLEDAPAHSFAVLDEFGGLELLVPEFYRALTAFLQSDTPCLGVLKSEEACRKLRERVPLDSRYPALAQQLRAQLAQDPDTLILKTTGWQDEQARRLLRQWCSALSQPDRGTK